MFTEERIKELNEDRLEEVKPELREKVKRLIALARERGYSIVVTQGFRTVAEQNALYAQGRTKPGKIVTNAKGTQSNHTKGIAADLAFVVNGQITWDDRLYTRIGAWADAVGLKWGGNWQRFKDLPHVEL